MQVFSPCISVCVIGDDGWCDGCLRTIEEIAGWGNMTNDERLKIMEDAPRRYHERNPDD